MKPSPEEISTYVSQLFNEHPHAELLYHNWEHTQRVVGHSMQIADHSSIEEEDRFILYAASYFHDTGHLLGVLEGHERVGVEIMKDFFCNKQTSSDRTIPDRITPDDLTGIERCILATQWPVRPRTLLEKIICDADTFHLGTEEFLEMDGRVWDEMQRRTGRPIDHRAQRSLRFLETHQYYTEYCQHLLNEGKRKNWELLRAMIATP